MNGICIGFNECQCNNMYSGKFCEVKVTKSKTDNFNIFAKESLSNDKKIEENGINLMSIERELNNQIVNSFDKQNDEKITTNKKSNKTDSFNNSFNNKIVNNTSISNISFLEISKIDEKLNEIDPVESKSKSLSSMASGLDEKLNLILDKPINKEYLLYFSAFSLFLIILAIILKK